MFFRQHSHSFAINGLREADAGSGAGDGRQELGAGGAIEGQKFHEELGNLQNVDQTQTQSSTNR